jgi:hypothetical protein
VRATTCFVFEGFHAESKKITLETDVKLIPPAKGLIEARSIFELPGGSLNLSINLPLSNKSNSPVFKSILLPFGH